MGKLLWDGDEEPDEDAEEIVLEDEPVEIEEEPVEIEENSQDSENIESPDVCEHPWESVTREKMKRIVMGSTIDAKDIYWCNSCKSILDVIE